MKHNLLGIVLSLIAHFEPAMASGKIVVIAGKDSDLSRLSRDQVKAVFLGETRRVGPGKTVRIGYRDRNLGIFKEFYAQLSGMSPKEVSVHWAKKVFTGEALAPTLIPGDDAATKKWVESNLDGISYIYMQNADSSVKVIGSLAD